MNKDETLVWCILDAPTGGFRRPWQIYNWYTDEMYSMISKNLVFDTYELACVGYIKAQTDRLARQQRELDIEKQQLLDYIRDC